MTAPRIILAPGTTCVVGELETPAGVSEVRLHFRSSGAPAGTLVLTGDVPGLLRALRETFEDIEADLPRGDAPDGPCCDGRFGSGCFTHDPRASKYEREAAS